MVIYRSKRLPEGIIFVSFKTTRWLTMGLTSLCPQSPTLRLMCFWWVLVGSYLMFAAFDEEIPVFRCCFEVLLAMGILQSWVVQHRLFRSYRILVMSSFGYAILYLLCRSLRNLKWNLQPSSVHYTQSYHCSWTIIKHHDNHSNICKWTSMNW